MSQPDLALGLPLTRQVRIRTTFSRSVNLVRDGESLALVRGYVPTSRARSALEQVAGGLAGDTGSRALALIGPYGSGKSAFALFLGALLGAADSPMGRAARETLERAAPELGQRFQGLLPGNRGCLVVRVNGMPDSLVRQLLLALADGARRAGLTNALVAEIRDAARPGTPMDTVLALVERVQVAWGRLGGGGLLIEIDELGKFLEYESHHPEHREIHLLQLLAEKAAGENPVALQLVVMLHQSFEHYSSRLGKHLRDEWQKIQGRFASIAFLEPAEQTLRVVEAAFEREVALSSGVARRLGEAARRLAAEGALPLGMDAAQARQLFEHCYPLHPLTLLVLPVLCQKIAQNERTLFSYLSSAEPFGLQQRLAASSMGDWIHVWELYDYFVLNQAGGFSDPLTYHRWIEVITALERFEGVAEDGVADPAERLLKTIGLLNLIGAQRGLKASRGVLALLFGEQTGALLARLEAASVVHFRKYSGEYRVWQGSDFDLHGALRQAVAEHFSLPLADILNKLSPLRPIVARRASIETGTLRSFDASFTSRERWPPAAREDGSLPLWFYLAGFEEAPDLARTPPLAVVAVCRFTERLREVVAEWMALRDLPRHHAALQEDAVAQREHQAWLLNAETEAVRSIDALLEAPEELEWYFGGEWREIPGRRVLQRALSDWVMTRCFPQAPLIRNELINRERPSASAATGRKRLLAAMLAVPGEEGLGIEKAPAEKSLYLSLLKETGLHRRDGERWDFFPPPSDDPCRLGPLWEAISAVLGGAGERQVPVAEIYARLQAPPFGVRLGVLPILLIAYLLAHRREVALYQEGAFCEALTLDHAELLCRRPALFALERFELAGLRGDLFDQYLGSIVGRVREDATLLDIVKPLVKFANGLPEYSQYCAGLSVEADRVRAAFRQAKSPGALLFDALPRACGFEPEVFSGRDAAAVESFIGRLIQALRELKGAYPVLLAQWQEAMCRELLDVALLPLAELREKLTGRFAGLDRYAPEHGPVGVLVRRLTDRGFSSDESWFESVLTLLGSAPPAKWREGTRLHAELRLAELGTQLHELEQLRHAVPEGEAAEGAVLVKVVDARHGEVSRVLRLDGAQQRRAADAAARLVSGLEGLDRSTQFAAVAELLKRLNQLQEDGGQDDE